MRNKPKQYCRPSGNDQQQQQKDGAVAGKQQQAVSTTNRKPAAQLAGERQQKRSTFAGSNQRNSNNNQTSFQQSSSSSRNERPKFPIGWAQIEKIDAQVKNKDLLEGSGDLLAAMDKESVYLRMDELWPQVEKQEVFLRLIVLTSSATHAGIQHTTQAFLRRTLQSKLVSSLEKHILQFGPHNQRSVNIVTSLAELLLLGWTTCPSLMADSLALQTKCLILNVKQQKSDQFPSKDFDDLLKRLDVAMKSFLDRKNAGVSIEHGAAKAGGNRNNQQRWNDESTGPPAEDFRTISVQLCEENLLTHNEAVYLRKAIVEGPYTDDEHYLDVQFRLLREDLCRPLRAGIHDFRAKTSGQNSLLVYNNVNFMGIELHTQDGKMAYLRLSPRDQRRKLSRRFIFGSLICLSDDGFDNNFIFGTVVDRDGIDGGGRRQQQQQKNRRFTIEKRGTIGILLQSVEAAALLRQGIAYHLVESPAFYECYSHVLRALQSIRPGQPIPFSDYLVRMQQNPGLPQYQRDNDRPVLLNFSSLLVRDPQGPEMMTRCSSTQLTEQFTADQFGMDRSQFEAFAYALRSELAVIQGPPGTGKTFLGLKIVKLLFDNQHLWRDDLLHRRPMLIVCYTNHALDQFLEGILSFIPDGIVRVGGRSKNEALEEFNLRNIQNDRNTDVDYAQRKRFWACREALKRLDISMQRMKKELFGPTKDPGWIVSHAQLFRQQQENALEPPEDPFDTTLKQKYRAFFAKNSYEAWLTSAKPVGSAAERLEIHTFVSHLVRQCHIPEVDSKLAYIYYMSTGDCQISDNNPFERRASLKRLRYWLRSSGREPEFRETIREWPTLAEVDFLLRIGLDEEVAVELLSSIKRDGQYKENINQIRQHSLGGHQQSSSGNIPEDFEATEPQEYDHDDDDDDDDDDEYADQENEARRFDDGDFSFDEDDFPAADQLGVGRVEEHNFQISAKLRKFLGKISTPLSDLEAQQMATKVDQTNPWDLPLLTRWRLYKRWVQQWKPGAGEEHNRLIREYCAKRNELDELRSLADIEIMRRAKVIGMTTTKAAHLQSALRSVRPRIVVVEEAAEVFEQHIVTALTECCEHLILIGDHQQLRPAPADYWLGKKYNLDISLFERLVLNGFEYRQLRLQHRMRPEIASTMMWHFYTNLQDHSSVREYPDVLGLQKNLFFLNHSQPESSKQDEAKSHANPFEAEFAVQLAKYLHKQGYEGSKITILCTYSDQFFDIRQRMAKCFGADKSHGIRVANVDNYQGEECDIIILSLVRSNNPMNRIGFLNTPNRVCVAMSRAKHGFYIIGNMDFLARNCNTNSPNSSGAEGKNLWADIKQSLVAAECIGSALPIVCQVHGNKQQIAQPKQFDQFAPEGGCTQPCGVRMDCGHTCRKPCHAFDPEHTKMKCMEKCGRMCANELHNCSKWCFEECDQCTEPVLRTLLCGHSLEAECHKNLEDLHCKEPCQSKLPCGHRCANKCGEKCTEKCKVPTERKLRCGHTMKLACHLDPLAQQCQQPVQKVWPICGHVAEAKCCADPAQLSCPAPCGQPLADCGHLCSGTCGRCRRGRLHQDCAEPCKRILICGHECRKKCARVCPPCPLPCETACVHSKCNMKVRHPNNKNNPGRKCGERCTPCAEKCANKCAHQACSKKCSEPCDIEPCSQPCSKPLPCSIRGPEPIEGSVQNSFQIVHPCIGVCGEPCLDICAICNPERVAEIKEIFFGTEDEEGARFVKLVDCGHIFEAKGLDTAIKVQLENRSTDGGDSAAIVVIKCPKCATPIRRSTRYIKLLNERAMQIDKVKKKLLGDKSKEQLLAEWEELKKALDLKQLPDLIEPISTSSAAEVEAIQKIKDAFDKIKKSLRNCQNHEITGQWMVMAENIDRLLLGFAQAVKRIFDAYSLLDVGISAGVCGPHLYNALHNTIRVEHLREYLLKDLAELLGSLAKRKVRSLAESTLDQMSSELAQHNFVFSIFHWVGKRHQQHQRGDIDAKGEQMLTMLLSTMQAARAFSEQKEKLEQMFNDLVNYTGDVPVSKEEMIQIKRALDGHVTKWYICPKGHIYGIGECGQAMQESHCIECKETVGGNHHRLVATNREAADLNREYHLRRAAENPFQARF